MTGTDLCVNKCKQSRSYLNHLVVASCWSSFTTNNNDNNNSSQTNIMNWNITNCVL